MKIDVIIPTYKPGKGLFDLLDRLENQNLPVNKIILMNTERRFFEGLISEEEFASRYANVEVHHLKKEEFDHGATRHCGVQYSDAEVFILMTQDAMPVDGNLTENLTKHLNGRVAAAYGRQLPRENCTLPERISREFNYPERTVQKGSEDLERMGIKTYFCSNVCAAYRREIYDEMGGFIRRTISLTCSCVLTASLLSLFVRQFPVYAFPAFSSRREKRKGGGTIVPPPCLFGSCVIG